VLFLPKRLAVVERDEDDAATESDAPQFDSVFDALEWAEVHPRTLSDRGLMMMPTIDDMKERVSDQPTAIAGATAR
jgi:hypothetical protein